MDCEYGSEAILGADGSAFRDKAISVLPSSLQTITVPHCCADHWARQIAKAPNNLDALAQVERFLQGEFDRLLIHGAQGTGKSLFLHTIQRELVRRGGKKLVRMYRADQWLLQRQPVRNLRTLLVDDLHAILGVRSAMQALVEAIGTVLQNGGQVVLTSSKMPSCREWQRCGLDRESWHFAQIRQPRLADRVQLIGQMLERRGLQLEEESIRLIAERVRGSMHGLQGALHRLLVLREHGGQLALSPARVAALLGPLESGGAYAELPEAVKAVIPRFGYSGDQATDFAAFLLSRYAGMPECVVADWLAISRSRVHHGARRIEALADLDPEMRESVRLLTKAFDEELLRGARYPC